MELERNVLFIFQGRHTFLDWREFPHCPEFLDWHEGPFPTHQARSLPTYGNQSRTGGISITSATTSPRIRLVVPVPTPTTPIRPHRLLPVHTSGLIVAPRLIKIATSTVLSMVVSLTPFTIAFVPLCRL